MFGFKTNLSDLFKKIIKVGYSMDIMRQSTCLVVNPNHGFIHMVSWVRCRA